MKSIIKKLLKKIFGCNVKWRRKPIIGGTTELCITCNACFAEFIMTEDFEKIPDEWMPFCPYCNTIFYIDEFTKEDMFKKEEVT